MTPLYVFGQELIVSETGFLFGNGLGCVWPERAPALDLWSGLGPHSPGGESKPERITIKDCTDCGAGWFLPLLERLKCGDTVTLEEVQQEHFRKFGRPMIEAKDDREIIEFFTRHVASGGKPERFFPACRIVKADNEKKVWEVLYTT